MTKPATDQPSRFYRLELVAVLVAAVALSAGGAIYLGQDANWDQRNYHLYAVYAWLTDRIDVDVAPSQIQTWLSPLPHLPAYLLIKYAPPMVAGFVLGGLAGLNGLCVWILARRLQKHSDDKAALAIAAGVTVLALSGSVFISFLGTTFVEPLLSPFVLVALIFLTSSADGSEPAGRDYLLAGCSLGVACGLKLTSLVFALGLAATLLLLWPVFRFRLGSLLLFAVGGLMASVLVGAYWATKLWTSFASPMFPFFNGIFQSPLFPPVNFADTRFLSPSFKWSALTYPFYWLLGQYPTSELFFREPRFALVAVFVPLAIVVSVLRFRSQATWKTRIVASRDFWLCTCFFLLSYLIWVKQFGIQRYALPLELMTGIVLLVTLDRVLHGPREVAAMVGVLAVFALVWTHPPNWERVPYGKTWFEFPAFEESRSTLYVMTSWQAMAYVVPYMPETARFVRMSGNMPLEPESPLGQRALGVIQAHNGPLRTLSTTPVVEPDEQVRLERFGLRVQNDSCTTFRSTMDTFWTCAVTRMPQAATLRP